MTCPGPRNQYALEPGLELPLLASGICALKLCTLPASGKHILLMGQICRNSLDVHKERPLLLVSSLPVFIFPLLRESHVQGIFHPPYDGLMRKTAAWQRSPNLNNRDAVKGGGRGGLGAPEGVARAVLALGFLVYALV